MVNILKVCKEILDNNNLNEIGIYESEDNNSAMYYYSESHSIFINESCVIDEAQEEGIAVEDYAKILFCHELGHAVDKNINNYVYERTILFNKIYENPIIRKDSAESKRLEEIYLISEEQAWINGMRFIDDNLLDKYIDHQTLMINSDKICVSYFIQDQIDEYFTVFGN